MGLASLGAMDQRASLKSLGATVPGILGEVSETNWVSLWRMCRQGRRLDRSTRRANVVQHEWTAHRSTVPLEGGDIISRIHPGKRAQTRRQKVRLSPKPVVLSPLQAFESGPREGARSSV
jgi:hypothetical protein